MLFSSAIASLAIMASSASAQIQLENVASCSFAPFPPSPFLIFLVVLFPLSCHSRASDWRSRNLTNFTRTKTVEAYAGPGCQPQAVQQQNINSNQCYPLPLQSARVFFLEKNRANCQCEFSLVLFFIPRTLYPPPFPFTYLCLPLYQ
jgi:hypothetical protein